MSSISTADVAGGTACNDGCDEAGKLAGNTAVAVAVLGIELASALCVDCDVEFDSDADADSDAVAGAVCSVDLGAVFDVIFTAADANVLKAVLIAAPMLPNVDVDDFVSGCTGRTCVSNGADSFT